MTYHLIPRIFCVGLCLLFFLAGSSLYAQTPTERIAQFQAATDAQVSVQEATQVANFVRLPQERAFRLAGGSVAEKATRFLQDYGKMFGIENPVTQLRPQSNIEDRQGFQRYVLEQHYHNVPIFDGKLQFHFNANKDIAAINGTFLPDINLNPIPTLSVATAEAIALETVTTQQRGVLNAPLSIQKNDLYIFNAGLPQGFRSTDHLVYRIEVSNALDVREFVFVDAHKGDIVAQYTGIANALYRRLYQNNTGNQIWQEGDPFPAALTNAQQNQVVVAGHTYHFFNNAFGRDSYDGNGAEMRSIDSFNGFVCSSSANATWNGETANFCPSLATDDIVGHEWAHAYTEYTNGLIYAHEAGAINEAYSDIWGETIDLLNNYEDAGEDNSIRTGKNSSTDCAESNRWKIGEDQTAFGTGAIRDMWIPSCNFDPDFVGSTDFDCDKDLSDNGGVHSNSGIPNHVYALLVDGGTYNGQTINALGFVKTAHIFWRTQTVYLTNTSDFGVLADALEQACQDLVDINLEGLSVSPTPAGLSGEIITAADGAEVAKAILAVNMRGDNACNYNTLLQPTTPICGGAGVAGETIFSENWEAGSSNWIVSQVPSDASTWDARDWTLTSNLPDGRTGTAMFGVDPSFGDCANTDRDNGIIRLQSPVINIGASVTPPFLMTFDHYISLEKDRDGGHLFYRINSGTWTALPSTAFDANGYNTTLQAFSNNNPYAGQDAFSGADEDFPSGTWGQSQIDLSRIGLTAGDDLELRWEVSTDACTGWEGWYIDDILIYSCTPPNGANISFSTSSATTNESNANTPNTCLDYHEVTLTMNISAVPSQPVNVAFYATGTASPTDYDFTPGSFTFDASNTTQDIRLRIYDDALIEGTETLHLNYNFNANGGNGSADIINQTYSLTIQDNDAAPNNVTGVTILSEDFNAGISNWTVIDGGNTTTTWQGVATAPGGSSSLNNTPFLLVDSNVSGPGSVLYEIIESPSLNTQGTTNMSLSFEQFFQEWAFDYAENCFIEVWDGSSWQNIFTQTQADGTQGGWGAPATVNVSIPDAYANTNMKLRFIYDSQHDYWWAVDNIVITGDQATPVQTLVNTTVGDEQYLGPNAEIYFFDPASGHIMARIKNLTAHDYGCTTVEVERAGNGTSAAWASGSADFILDKTFQVTPEFPNAVGNYEISLYYTEAEVAAWETATGRARTALMHLQTPNNLPTPNATDTRTYQNTLASAYGADWAYTATYSTPFADFGLGPVEPSVTLAPKVFLQGAMNTTNMNDNLRTAGLVPTLSPYAAMGYVHTGTGANTVLSERLQTTGSKAVVDWVIVELRDAVSPNIVLASRAALLLQDGTVVDTDGSTALRFPNRGAGNYHVAIRHRNHLGVMTKITVYLD